MFKICFEPFNVSLKNCTMYACNSFSIWKSIQFCNFYVQAHCAYHHYKFLKFAFEKKKEYNFYLFSISLNKLHYVCLLFLFHLKEYPMLQLLCAGILCLPPLEMSQFCIWKILVAKICRNHACFPQRCTSTAALVCPKMAPTLLVRHTE